MKQILDIESKNALVKYRLERASETMKEAALLSGEGYFNAAINRLYYACYYAVISLLLKNDLQAQSHAGVKTMFGLHFVSSGIVPIEIGKTLSTLLKNDKVAIMMISFCVQKKMLLLLLTKPILLSNI